LDYSSAAFRIDGKVHASEREGLILAATNPLDATHMILVVAGNDSLSTVKTEKADLSNDEYEIFEDGGAAIRGFIHRSGAPPAQGVSSGSH
jgi:hypothetical protein